MLMLLKIGGGLELKTERFVGWGIMVRATTGARAVGSLVVRASDSRPEGLGSMPPNTLRVHTEYVLVKSVGPKSCGMSHERRDWRIFPSHSVQCRNCGGEDRWCRHLSSLRGISPS
ncbi:uncharacterized protein TNCV_1572931 [Trichonephila clavipes]|uniref:Uncharacterized protein n=1 Tax=Trichonephila clavipes TaxID=2585209 RepID=A0A8X6SKM0_TRICX|nr:uncharacterized protein TNCV_1572931 [Trichonephila clavipes]